VTSLRANGSRECAPDDRLREAIQGHKCRMDCFVASAPRNGDYPVLDKGSSKPLRWLRQGGAALLLAFIVFGSVGKAVGEELKEFQVFSRDVSLIGVDPMRMGGIVSGNVKDISGLVGEFFQGRFVVHTNQQNRTYDLAGTRLLGSFNLFGTQLEPSIRDKLISGKYYIARDRPTGESRIAKSAGALAEVHQNLLGIRYIDLRNHIWHAAGLSKLNQNEFRGNLDTDAGSIAGIFQNAFETTLHGFRGGGEGQIANFDIGGDPRAIGGEQSVAGYISSPLCSISRLMSTSIGAVKEDALTDSDKYQKQSEKRQEGVGDFQPSPEKYTVLGSLFSAFLGLIICLPLGVFGGVRILDGRYWLGSGCLSLSLCLAFCSTFGLLFNFDLWSLWRLL
jgi:hypothetical protein